MREKKTKKVKKYLTFELKYINIIFVRLIHNQDERMILDENHIKSRQSKCRSNTTRGSQKTRNCLSDVVTLRSQ